MTPEIISLISSGILGVLGILATILFSRAANKREHDKMLKEIFMDCNDRYSKLNDALEKYVKSEKG